MESLNYFSWYISQAFYTLWRILYVITYNIFLQGCAELHTIGEMYLFSYIIIIYNRYHAIHKLLFVVHFMNLSDFGVIISFTFVQRKASRYLQNYMQFITGSSFRYIIITYKKSLFYCRDKFFTPFISILSLLKYTLWYAFGDLLMQE